MPDRSSSSSIFTWPDRAAVEAALARWSVRAAADRTELLRVGYFGSYVRDEWGVGSDLDVVIVLDRSELPFLERGRDWDLAHLPVPADVLIYTVEELRALLESGGRFAEMLREETVWVYERE